MNSWELFKAQSKNYRMTVYSLIVLILITCGVSFYMGIYAEFTYKEQVRLEGRANQLDVDYDAKKQELLEEVNLRAQSSNFIILSTNAKVNDVSLSFEEKGKELFDIIFVWHNGEDYKSRKERAKDLATREVLESGFFEKGLDRSGDSMVDVLGYKSRVTSFKWYTVEFDPDKDDFLKGYVALTQELQQTDTFSGYTEYLFQVEYDRNTDKFTSLNYKGVRNTGDLVN